MVRYCFYLSSEFTSFYLIMFICFIRPLVLSRPNSLFIVHCSSVSASRFHSWALPLNRIFIVHCSLVPSWQFIVLVLVHAKKVWFIDLIIVETQSKVHCKASFKIAHALIGPKSKAFDSTKVTYWVFTHCFIYYFICFREGDPCYT